MVTIPWWFVRYGFPVLALAAVTVGVLVLRGAIHDGDAAPAAATPTPAVVAKPMAKAKARAKSAQATAYSIRSGDTLASIADRFGTSIDRLMELNPGIDPTALRVGQAIRVG